MIQNGISSITKFNSSVLKSKKKTNKTIQYNNNPCLALRMHVFLIKAKNTEKFKIVKNGHLYSARDMSPGICN